MLINHYTDHKQHTTQPPTPDKPPGINSHGPTRPTGVEREPDSMLAFAQNAQPSNAPTPTTQAGSIKMQAQETHTQPQ